MKKTKIIGIIGLCSLSAFFLISSMSLKEEKDGNISKIYKDIRHFGPREFINMDLGLINYLTEQEQWSQISKNIRKVPIDSLRYIDSLDINNLKDSLYIKVYSQNYAYQSNNSYKIGRNTKKLTDVSKINICFDLKMKEKIADAETFRVKNFTVDFATKQNIDNIEERIIFIKNYR